MSAMHFWLAVAISTLLLTTAAFKLPDDDDVDGSDDREEEDLGSEDAARTMYAPDCFSVSSFFSFVLIAVQTVVNLMVSYNYDHLLQKISTN
jgi:hypothetical protein